MAIFIFANGDIEDVEWIRPLLPQASKTIAANGGSQHLFALNHPPDVIIGDLDSLVGEVREWAETAVSQIISYPREKDETDLELALIYAANLLFEAIAENKGEIRIFGALGGRLDQTVANILLLAHPSLKGIDVQLVDEQQRAWLVTDNVSFNGELGDLVSLIPLGGDVHIQQTVGLHWSLKNEPLFFGPARGVSNEIVGKEVEVVVKNGRLLCIHTKKEWGR